jgi:hypothetical protein
VNDQAAVPARIAQAHVEVSAELLDRLAWLTADLARFDEVLGRWRESMAERRGSSILRLPDVLVEQPVVDAKYLAERLNITPRAANNLLDRACSYGILRPVGTARRGVFYQADELIAVLEDIADARSIRRVLATGRLGS